MTTTCAQSANDDKFCKWLGLVGNKQVSGHKILHVYVQSKAGPEWDRCVADVCKERHDWWPLLRGRLSASQILECKARYLDQFVFICKDAAALPFVDALLRMEDAQISHRLADYTHSRVACTQCEEKALIIDGLRKQLKLANATPVETARAARLAVLEQEFARSYIFDCSSSTARNALRLHMEQHLQKLHGVDERLPAHGPLWKMFCDSVIRTTDRCYRPFRIRKRARPLSCDEI